ncbi:MAG: hypothetical protein HY908_10885, partial [Myxococcales bacterium]|nr:hypothetical protein [Myxococcales bacterium]
RSLAGASGREPSLVHVLVACLASPDAGTRRALEELGVEPSALAAALLLAKVELAGAAALGARALEQTVEAWVTQPLAAGMVDGRFERGSEVCATVVDGRVTLVRAG